MSKYSEGKEYFGSKRKTEDYLWSEHSASDTSNIVQTAGLTAFTCEPLEAKQRNAKFENHMKPKSQLFKDGHF